MQIDPLSKPVAISEMLLLLGGSAFIGWLLARWIVAGRINGLRESIQERRSELNDYKASSTPTNATLGRITAIGLPGFALSEPISSVPDNLKLVEGIGPKIESLLHASGILTFAKLAAADPAQLSSLLKAGGPRFQVHDPGTWPQQAALARDGQWEKLKLLQNELNGGKK